MTSEQDLRGAKWIWTKSHSDAPNFYMYARKEIDVQCPSRGVIYVTCSTKYRLYVNGRHVGRGPSPSPSSLQCYDEYDLKRYLRPGRNVIGVVCHFCDGLRGGLLVRAELENGSSGATDVVSDETWRVIPAADWDTTSTLISPSIGFQEINDSRKKPMAWNVVGFDDSDWEEPEVICEAGVSPWGNLFHRQIPLLREWEAYPESVLRCGIVPPVDDPTLDIATRMHLEATHTHQECPKSLGNILRPGVESAEVNGGSDTFVTVDFGRLVVGYPALKIRDGGGGIVDVGYSDTLDDNGNIDPTKHDILQADRLILHGGRQEWQAFNRRAFRYMQLTFRDVARPVVIESVHIDCIAYPADQLSTFQSSDPILNDIWGAGIHTLSLCMQDSYEESNINKRAQFLANARIQALMNYYCFFDSALITKTLWQFAKCADDAQPEDFPLWVITLHDYYLHTGDRDLVEHLYPDLRRIVNGWSNTNEAVFSAFQYQAIRDASKLAVAVNENDDAMCWGDSAAQLFRTFNDKFWSDGVYADSDAVNALAIVFGLSNVDQNTSIVQRFSSCALDLSTLPAFYILQALAKLDMAENALDLVRQIQPDAAVHFLPSEILGVKPSMPDSGVVVIQPRVGDLQWAKGCVMTHGGFVEVEWHAEPSRFYLDINAPSGYIAALPVGSFTNPIVEEIDLSPETPERRARKTYGWGNVIWRAGEERDPYLDWLASQEENPPETYKRKTRCGIQDQWLWVRESNLTHVRYEIRSDG
ncbi:MAG: family 78 glycoside hydrolase catalytic domain [Armatimonadota bacterium]